MYALEPAWRDTLQAPAPGVLPLAVGDGLDAASWAGHEFGGARLGDARLSARLVLSAEQMAESPMRAITGAANGVRALVKGHYRLIDQPAESAVTVENILAPHRERTLRRMRTHDTVLCIQDGTRLNFTRRSQTRGLGTIGSNQTGAAARGLDLHTTLAVNPDGVALGVLRAAFDAPEPPKPEEKGKPKPQEERKSFRWVEGLRDCAAAAEQLGETRVVCTMDREADFLDLFIERRTHAPAGRTAGPGEGRPRAGEGEDGRRAHGLAPSVRRGARRAGPRRRHGRGAAAERAGEGQQTGSPGRPCGPRRRGDPALPAGGAVVPRGRAGRAVCRPCARGTAAARGQAAGVVRADHAAGDQRRRRHAHPGLVRPAVAHRRVLPGPQVRLQGRGIAAPRGGAARTGHGHQDGRRVADPVDGPARTRDA